MEPHEAPYWISVAQFETILDRLAAPIQCHRFRITFDDGNLSDHDIALPRLLDRGLRAEFFVLSGRIGLAGSLDIPQILSLQNAGMTIGSHGVAHKDWRNLDDHTLAVELTDSRRNLESICRQPVTAAGIPFGGYNAGVLRALRRAGYKAAYSSDRGGMNSAAFLRPRTSVTSAMNSADIAAILSGQMPMISRLRRMIGMARRRIV